MCILTILLLSKQDPHRVWNRDCDFDDKELMIFPLMGMFKDVFSSFNAYCKF